MDWAIFHVFDGSIESEPGLPRSWYSVRGGTPHGARVWLRSCVRSSGYAILSDDQLNYERPGLTAATCVGSAYNILRTRLAAGAGAWSG
jgi:hypothetical protein